MPKQRGLAVVGMFSVMVAMFASAMPAAAVPPPRGLVPFPGPPVVRSALAWGSNSRGQVGDGSTAVHRAVPVQPFGLDRGVTQVAAGWDFTLAVQNGTVFAWGNNDTGQLGDGTLDQRLIPTAIPTLTNVTRVSAGYAHSLALRTDGTVWAWGANTSGQLGNGTRSDRRRPVRVSNLTGVTDIAAGHAHSLALRSDGTVWAWGNNEMGQLGDGTFGDRLRPVKVLGLANVVQVAVGSFHSMAVRSDGVAFGWGANRAGQLGDGSRSNRVVPGRVTFLTGVTQVAAGWNRTHALSNGRAYWWGEDCECAEGNGPPVLHLVDLTDVAGIASGLYHYLAVRSDGTLWWWGSGTGSPVDPVLVPAASGVVRVDGGGAHTVVVVEHPVVIGP
jgi:alpha-tubulin suppressor-like RCC1 family protein